MDDDWLVWQLADSAFPSGGFAHSGGLESAWQQGLVGDGKSLRGFVEAALNQTARGAAPFAVAACADPCSFDFLDHSLDVMLTNHVAHRASRGQGRSLLSSSARIFVRPAIVSLEDRVRHGQSAAHLAPVFGAIAGHLGLTPERAGRMFIFMTLRGLLSGAVRLGAIGPIEAQGVQAALAPAAARAADLAMQVRPEDACQTAPLIDLLQGMQDRLYSRLFQS